MSTSPSASSDWSNPGSGTPQPSFDFVGMLQRRFWIIVLCILFATGGGVFWYWKSEVKYTSYAKAYIDLRTSEISIIGNDGFSTSNKITSHDEIIRSETVLSNAADEILRIMREGTFPTDDNLLVSVGDESDDSLLQDESASPDDDDTENNLVDNVDDQKSTTPPAGELGEAKPGKDELASDEESGQVIFPELQGKNRGQILSHLSRAIDVVQDRDDKNIYRISYSGRYKNDCGIILGIVINQYKKHLERKYESEGRQLLENIENAKDRIQVKMRAATKTLQDFRRKNRQRFEDLRNGIQITENGKVNRYRLEAQSLYDDIETLKSKQEGLAADKAWIEAAIASDMSKQELLTHLDKFNEWLQIEQKKMSNPQVGSSTSPQPLLQFDEPEPPSTLIQARFNVTSKENDIQALLDKGFGANYPGVKRLRRELDELKNQLAFHEEDHKNRVAKARDKFEEMKKLAESAEAEAVPSEIPSVLKDIDLIGLHQAYLKQQLSRNEKELKKLGDRLSTKRADALLVDELLSEEVALQRDIDVQQSLNDAVVSKIGEVDLEKDQGGYILDLLNSPGKGTQTEPSVLKIFAITTFLGIVAGVGLSYLIEIADKTFRTPAEVAQHLGMQVIGHVPVLSTKKVDSKGSAVDDVLVAFHLPKSQQAEAFRAIRTSIFFNNQGKRCQILQVTSPTPGDGKSTLAANLAISLAQSGKRVLVIDADLRRPTSHYLFGIDSEIGFAAVLNGDAEIEDAISETEVDGLSLMPAGSKPSNPSELLTSSRMYEMFEVLRERYDFIIMDSPPMLAVTDPAAVAARVDGVILALRIKKNIKLSAKRAKEVLDSVNANLLGVVVNGAGMVQGTYSNSAAYGYGYGYGSGYGYAGSYYSYGYDYGESSYYYNEGENRPTPVKRS